MPGWSRFMFQEAGSKVMIIAQSFHDYVLLVLILTLCVIGVVIMDLGLNKASITNFTDYSVLEV
jgi:hypothetical protein